MTRASGADGWACALLHADAAPVDRARVRTPRVRSQNQLRDRPCTSRRRSASPGTGEHAGWGSAAHTATGCEARRPSGTRLADEAFSLLTVSGAALTTASTLAGGQRLGAQLRGHQRPAVVLLGPDQDEAQERDRRQRNRCRSSPPPVSVSAPIRPAERPRSQRLVDR